MNCTRKISVRRDANLRGQTREERRRRASGIPAPMTSLEKRRGSSAPRGNCFCAMAWAGLFLAVTSPPLGAGIILESRQSTASAGASASVDGGSNIFDSDLKGQSDFLPAALSASATATGTQASGSGAGTANSQITLDSSGESLVVTGSASCQATASATQGEIPRDATGTGQGLSIILDFEVTDTSYPFDVTGSLSAVQGDPDTGSVAAEVSLRDTSVPFPDGFLFDDIARGGENKNILESGMIPPGHWEFLINAASAVTVSTNSGDLGGTNSATISNVSFTVASSTPPPAPIQWNNSAGGSFHTATNWDPQMVPGANDTALFGLAVAYSVDVGTAGTKRLEIRNGDVTFTNADYAVAATDFDPAGILLDNSKLTLAVGFPFDSLRGVHALIGESAASRMDVISSTGFLGLTGSLRVGGAGNGILNIESGGTVESGEGRIGTGVGGGSVMVSGGTSSWTSGNLSVGYESGNGDLTISDGGVVTSGSGFVGFGTDLTGSVTVKGVDPSDATVPSSWRLDNDLILGQNGIGNLTVQDGASVECTNATFGVGNFGSASLSGATSSVETLDVSTQLTVGQSKEGFLEVTGGADAHAGTVIVGSAAFGHGLITLSGKSGAIGSHLEVDGSLILGLNGTGTLLIQEDATVTCSDAALGAFTGAIGSATLGVDNAAGAPAQWTVNGDLKIGGLAPGTIALHNSANVTVSQTLFILANGSIGGNGTYSAQTVENDGSNGPGNSVGTLILESDYEQTATGKLTIETSGLGAGEFDVLHVTGNAALGGTLEMLFLGDYLPKSGDSFKFLLVDGTISGEFAEVTFPQLLPGFQFDTTQVAGGLLFTALNDAVLAPTFLLNISTRLQVGTDDNVLIGGFILLGTEPKRVLIRAIGPSLEAAGVSGAMADPTLELHDSTGALVGQNNDWRTTQTGGLITEDQFLEIHATGIPPTSDAESAIVATLDPGAYTAIVAGADSSTGVGLAEVYDLGPAAAAAKLANISTRGFVQTGDNVMIGGFIIGNQTSQVLVRGIGPSLTALGVTGALADPMLELHDGNGALLASNDNWRSDQEAEIEATTIPPTDDLESAILRTLAPGAYTVILRGVSDATGVGLVEAYNLD